MKVIKDVDPINFVNEYDVILVGTSISCSMASGFQGKLIRKYPYVDEANDKQPYKDNRRLGTRLTLEHEGNPIISICYISKYNTSKNPTIDYDALTNCLATANAEFKGKKVLTTVMGGTKIDGYGDKEKCLQIIKENTKDLNIDVYDYEQMTAQKERRKICGEVFREYGRMLPQEEFKELIEKLFKERFVNNIYYNGTFK